MCCAGSYHQADYSIVGNIKKEKGRQISRKRDKKRTIIRKMENIHSFRLKNKEHYYNFENKYWTASSILQEFSIWMLRPDPDPTFLLLGVQPGSLFAAVVGERELRKRIEIDIDTGRD